jgi:hypothetical protein
MDLKCVLSLIFLTENFFSTSHLPHARFMYISSKTFDLGTLILVLKAMNYYVITQFYTL